MAATRNHSSDPISNLNLQLAERGVLAFFGMLCLLGVLSRLQFTVTQLRLAEVQNDTRSVEALTAKLSDASAGRRLSTEALRLLSVGHWPAWVDWTLIQVLLNADAGRIPPGQRAPIFWGLAAITELDPAHWIAYFAGGNLLSILNRDREGALELLQKGERFRKEQLSRDYPLSFKREHWSQEWMIPLMLGYLYLFEFEDLQSAARSYQEAASIAGAPPYLQSLVRRFEKPGGTYEVGLRHLRFLLSQLDRPAANSDLRATIERKIGLLEGAHARFGLQQQWQAFLAQKPSIRRDNLPAIEVAWSRFVQTLPTTALEDPRGGRFVLDPKTSQVVSTEVHERVLGLD